MTSQLLTQLLQALSLLSVLLLVGTFLRAKVKLFQSLYLPASVIGGFIGMIISPEILGRFSNYSISEEWIKTYSLLPGILSVPIFAAIPLGMFLNSSNNSNEKKSIKSLYPSKVLICFGLFQCAAMSQSAIGYATNMFFSKIYRKLKNKFIIVLNTSLIASIAFLIILKLPSGYMNLPAISPQAHL